MRPMVVQRTASVALTFLLATSLAICLFTATGAASALAPSSPASPDPSRADWKVESNQRGAELGSSVGSAGDVNGDGYDDVVVGAPYGGPTSEGQAFLYEGGPNGLATTPSWQATGIEPLSVFGIGVG